VPVVGFIAVSRNLKALIDTGSSGCIVLNEFTKGIHHKQSENPQQWMAKGGLFKTNGICSIKLYLPEFSTQESIKLKFHIDTSRRLSFKNCGSIQDIERIIDLVYLSPTLWQLFIQAS
jgi:hypothetical protein